MKRTLCTLAVALTALAPMVKADPQADADYIVSQSLTPEMVEGTIAALRPMVIGALQNEMRAVGLSLPEPERFLELFLEEFSAEFTEAMHDQFVALYLETFSEPHLADIAAFHRSEAGQALVAATPGLMVAGAQMGERASARAAMHTGKRLAARLQAENLIEIDDPALLYRFLGEPL